MGAKELLKEKLSRHPEIPFVEEGNRIEVGPADETGFAVILEETGDDTTVYFEGWHEDFENLEEAVQCFGFGLSEACRLRVTQRGSSPTGWAVESLQMARGSKTASPGCS
jgi:hypothetical protein